MSAFYFYGSTPHIDQLQFELSADLLASTPAWGLEAANPPLSIREALHIGESALREFVENESGWEFDRIRLVFDDGVDRWFYVVQYLRLRNEHGIGLGESERTHRFEIVVLMDGTTLHDPVPNPFKSDIPALHRAVTDGLIEVARLILERGDDVNAIDGDGRSALHRAIEIQHVDFVEFLISNGADVNLIDARGMSPIAVAARHYTKESAPNERTVFAALKDAGACCDLPAACDGCRDPLPLTFADECPLGLCDEYYGDSAKPIEPVPDD